MTNNKKLRCPLWAAPSVDGFHALVRATAERYTAYYVYAFMAWTRPEGTPLGVQSHASGSPIRVSSARIRHVTHMFWLGHEANRDVSKQARRVHLEFNGPVMERQT